jgi:phospholipase/carboxylesterase
MRRLFPLMAAGLFATSCLGDSNSPTEFRIEDATLLSRPSAPIATANTGISFLNLGAQRDGFYFVPTTYGPATPAPLLVLLHGAGESSQQWNTEELLELAEEFKVVLLAPDSRGRSLDYMTRGRFEGDVIFLDAALERVFQFVNVDPARIAIAGFSDGGSYALSLGLINGDLFSRVLAFSPGLVFAPERRGVPGIYITHGSNDPVLPVSNTRDNIVPLLREAGYTVEFVEFAGTHSLPVSVVRGAFQWMVPAP